MMSEHAEAKTFWDSCVLDARRARPQATLAELYHPPAMPPALITAHARLDREVDAAYVRQGGKGAWPSEAERVAFLFEKYRDLVSPLIGQPPHAPTKRRRSSARAR